MGLDTVELVTELEEALGVEVPDAWCARCATAGDLYSAAMQSIRSDPSCALAVREDVESEVWRVLEGLLARYVGDERASGWLRPEMTLVGDLRLD
ncbi:MAG: hypothetical protein AAF797_09325 [Planctomycetota bacterium]